MKNRGNNNSKFAIIGYVDGSEIRWLSNDPERALWSTDIESAAHLDSETAQRVIGQLEEVTKKTILLQPIKPLRKEIVHET